MYLTSVTNLKLTQEQFEVIDTMSYRAKALYNSAIYETNKYFEQKEEYIGYQQLDQHLRNLADIEENLSYRALPAQLSQQIIKKFDKNYKSFFSLLKMKQSNEYNKSIDTPKYKGKDDRKELIFAKSKSGQAFIFKDECIFITVTKDLHKGRMKLCKIPEYLKELDFDEEIKYMEIIPKLGSYSLHIVYLKEEKEISPEAKNWFSIDLGLNNLCTVTSNKTNSFIMNGRHIKSINQKYNKRIAKLKSAIKKSQSKSTSKELNRLYSTRGNKLNNEIHKITDFIVQSVIEHKIDFVVIGYNKGWKQNINIGKRNNQNFVQIPFSKILQHLEYKLRLLGIEVILQEESYTSKCSYFDNEEVKKHQTYKGKRINRGLFKTSNGMLINADVNGSLNIFKKCVIKVLKAQEVHDALLEPVDTGLVMNPLKIQIRTSTSLTEISALIQSL